MQKILKTQKILVSGPVEAEGNSTLIKETYCFSCKSFVQTIFIVQKYSSYLIISCVPDKLAE